MATAGDLVTRALKKAGILGVGQSASSEDSNDAFNDLNDMLAQWQRKRWLIYHLVDVAVTCTGAQSYTIGTGGNFNVARPDKLEAAYIRMTNPNPVDWPLEILEAREDYSEISLKNLSSLPEAVFYDAQYPMGLVYPWPVPSSIYELHLILKEQLGQFANLAQAVSLPPEYNAALMWNLALRLRTSYQMPPEPDSPQSVAAMARDSLNLIRNANAQVPRLSMPAGMGGRSGGAYNIYSDRS